MRHCLHGGAPAGRSFGGSWARFVLKVKLRFFFSVFFPSLPGGHLGGIFEAFSQVLSKPHHWPKIVFESFSKMVFESFSKMVFESFAMHFSALGLSASLIFPSLPGGSF